MNPIITRILMILSGVIASAALVEAWTWRTALSLLATFVAGIASFNAPGTKAAAEEKAVIALAGKL